MSDRQKYLLYLAYHEYQNNRVFPMDLALEIWEMGSDPSMLEDLFRQGLSPYDILSDDEEEEEDEELHQEFEDDDEISHDELINYILGITKHN